MPRCTGFADEKQDYQLARDATKGLMTISMRSPPYKSSQIYEGDDTVDDNTDDIRALRRRAQRVNPTVALMVSHVACAYGAEGQGPHPLGRTFRRPHQSL